MFATLRPAVDAVLKSFQVEHSTHFIQFVRDELSKINPEPQVTNPDKKRLTELYELRSRYLDWELGTGYLGFFSKNAGTRYTFTRRMEAVYQMLPEIAPETQILEIGCGAGLLCLELARTAKIIIGIDISHFALDFGNHVKKYMKCENGSFQISDAETLGFREQVFDLIICSEVLEHLIAPEKALSEIRRVVKNTGTVIVTTPCAVSLSDMAMHIFRIVNKHIESGKNVHFDKKTYLAVMRGERKKLSKFSKTLGVLNDKIFMRVHRRFRYNNLVTMFQQAGFKVEQAVGTVFAFPPHYQVFYRYCPAIMLLVIRGIEQFLNKVNLFQRFGSVTTCFRLKPVS
jgi:2-polyprenyl-3-methyl-5-hydroxy-6-metoxy-1,4-benzoquinol methylase